MSELLASTLRAILDASDIESVKSPIVGARAYTFASLPGSLLIVMPTAQASTATKPSTVKNPHSGTIAAYRAHITRCQAVVDDATRSRKDREENAAKVKWYSDKIEEFEAPYRTPIVEAPAAPAPAAEAPAAPAPAAEAPVTKATLRKAS